MTLRSQGYLFLLFIIMLCPHEKNFIWFTKLTVVNITCFIHRRPLFRQSVVLSHKKGEGESAFDWRSKIPPKASEMKPENLEAELEAKCDISLFVEPIEWMKGKIEHMEGKVKIAYLECFWFCVHRMLMCPYLFGNFSFKACVLVEQLLRGI